MRTQRTPLLVTTRPKNEWHTFCQKNATSVKWGRFSSTLCVSCAISCSHCDNEQRRTSACLACLAQFGSLVIYLLTPPGH